MSGPASPTPRRRYNVCRVTPNVSYQPVGLVLDVKGLQAPSEAALVLKHFLDHPDLAKAVEFDPAANMYLRAKEKRKGNDRPDEAYLLVFVLDPAGGDALGRARVAGSRTR